MTLSPRDNSIREEHTDRLDLASLQRLEFYVRPFLRQWLFEKADDRVAMGRFVDLLFEYRALTGNALQAKELCAILASSVTVHQITKLRHGHPSDGVLKELDRIVAALLLGKEGPSRLLKSSHARAPFAPRDWLSEDPVNVAARIMRVLFPTCRTRATGPARARARSPSRDDLGFFATWDTYAQNGYEARAELCGLAWAAIQGRGQLSSVVVRVSGGLPFAQIRRYDNKRDGELQQIDGYVLTRSGEETINFLLAGEIAAVGLNGPVGTTAVVHVLPEKPNDELMGSVTVFLRLAQASLGSNNAALKRFVYVPLPEAEGYFHPWLRFVFHQLVPQPGFTLAGLATPHLKFDFAGETIVNMDVEAVACFPNLFVQRRDADQFGPASISGGLEDCQHFESWVNERVVPALKKKNANVSKLFGA